MSSAARWILSSIIIAGLAACGDGNSLSSLNIDVTPPQDSGVLQVVARNGASTYYLDRHEQAAGPEHYLISQYAAERGWQVEWTMVDTTAEVIEVLALGQTHIAASGLSQTPSRNERFARGPAHTEVTQQLVCHRDMRPMPRTPERLAGVDITVTAGSSYVDTLSKLQQHHTGIAFSTDEQRTTEILLARVAEKKLDCTVADSNIAQITRRLWPSLEVAQSLSRGGNIGWYLPKGFEDLASDARQWMNSRSGDEAIGRMEDRYYSYLGEFDFVDLRALNRRIEERLPQFKAMFIQAEQDTGIAADLLAALAYQESHWDPEARSATGVRGLMMLTRATAESLGVSDRLDPAQSIDAGARYLADRHRRLPESINEPHRMFLALASYNIGRGHLLDARQLARDLGKNPDDWRDMREVLPLKADRRYYPSTRYGYARGYEPVHYVQRIRNYRDVIARAFD